MDMGYCFYTLGLYVIVRIIVLLISSFIWVFSLQIVGTIGLGACLRVEFRRTVAL